MAPSLNPSVPPRRSVALTIAFVAIAMLTLVLAGAWTYLTRASLATAIAKENQAQIDQAQTVFALLRTRAQDDLRAQCRMLSEDPRLKATLATEGIDEVTVADILNDLGQLRRGGFLLILSPEGRVFAQAGAEELRGLDLSSSSVVQRARTSKDAVVGSWVIGHTIMDLSAIPLRSDSMLTAYLVVGHAVDQELIKAVADSSGVAAAIGVGSEISIPSTDDPKVRATLLAITTSRQARGNLVSGGETYSTGFVELEQTQPRPYLVLAHSQQTSTDTFQEVTWLLWVPPGLVFVALLLARVRSKQLARRPRTGGA